MLFENLNRADVSAEESDVPFVAVEISDRNTRVVLHNRAAVIENEIADVAESIFEHQIGRGFEETAADAEVIAKFQETARGQSAV